MPTPITIRGIYYPSMTAAAKAIGVSVVAIHNARNEGRLATCGLGGGGGNRRPVTVYDDVLDVLTDFHCLKDAAEHIGVSHSTLSKARASAKKAGLDYIRVKSYVVTWYD